MTNCSIKAPVQHLSEFHALGSRWAAPLNKVLENIQIKDPQTARLVCKLIPAQCPFERDLKVWGHTLHIPAMCQLNPCYDALVQLRFQALVLLASHPSQNSK